jgi:hypothetical protein
LFYGLGGTSDWILWGDSLGCFPSGTANPGINSKFAQLSDVKGDGKLDLLATPYSCSGKYVFPDACTNFIGDFQSQKQKDGTIVFNTVGEHSLAPDEADTPQQ